VSVVDLLMAVWDGEVVDRGERAWWAVSVVELISALLDP
jgi:hypothetical protein